MNAAHKRIIARGGFATRGKADPVAQIAAEIVRHGDGEAFLKAVRRGRPTARQGIRYQLLREIEAAVGAGVPRRREDRNTPEAPAMRQGFGCPGRFPFAYGIPK